MRWARVSTGMYSISTFAPLWVFSKAATAASTTFSLGLLPTSWKSQTRSVPVFSSPSEPVSDVCGRAGGGGQACQHKHRGRGGNSGGKLHPEHPTD